jgi:hypothetical protein
MKGQRLNADAAHAEEASGTAREADGCSSCSARA